MTVRINNCILECSLSIMVGMPLSRLPKIIVEDLLIPIANYLMGNPVKFCFSRLIKQSILLFVFCPIMIIAVKALQVFILCVSPNSSICEECFAENKPKLKNCYSCKARLITRNDF